MAIVRTLSIGIKERPKFVKILGTGIQFQGVSPSNITLTAKLHGGLAAASYAWFKGSSTTSIGTQVNFVVANSQVSVVESYRVVVTDSAGVKFEDVVSISKVNNGSVGKSGKVPIQREWLSGDVYRNNDEVIDYIYHRATNTWWKLKDGFNNVTAGVNPGSSFVKLTSMEELAVGLVIAEQANIAGFIFSSGVLTSSNGVMKIDTNLGVMEWTSNGAKYRMGIDSQGFPVNEWFDQNGVRQWYTTKDGPVYENMAPEAFERSGMACFVTSNAELSGLEYDNFINSGRKKLIFSTGNPPLGAYRITMHGKLNSGQKQMFKYYAGDNSNSVVNKQYEGKIYTSYNKITGVISDGWYMEALDFYWSHASTGGIGGTYPNYNQVVNVVFTRYLGGGVAEVQEKKLTFDMENLACVDQDADGYCPMPAVGGGILS